MKKISLIFTLVLVITIIFSQAGKAQDKKPWSPQAKGTVIGAGAGAAAGAIIHKRNRVVGGVVGGVAGGATGYAIGKRKDNKNKEAARIAAAKQAEANRIAAANQATEAKKASTNTKQVAVTNKQPAGVNAQGFQAAPGTMVYDATGNLIPIVNTAYLPNSYYGNTSKPYYTSEIRRKSW